MVSGNMMILGGTKIGDFIGVTVVRCLKWDRVECCLFSNSSLQRLKKVIFFVTPQ